MFVILVLIKNYCNKHHLYYDYRVAQKNYEDKLISSRTGIDIDPNTIEDIEQQIVPLIKDKKQSVNQVYINHSDILYFSKNQHSINMLILVYFL